MFACIQHGTPCILICVLFSSLKWLFEAPSIFRATPRNAAYAKRSTERGNRDRMGRDESNSRRSDFIIPVVTKLWSSRWPRRFRVRFSIFCRSIRYSRGEYLRMIAIDEILSRVSSPEIRPEITEKASEISPYNRPPLRRNL